VRVAVADEQHPASYGTCIHLWKSNARESARSTPAIRGRSFSESMISAPNAPSTCIQRLFLAADRLDRFDVVDRARVHGARGRDDAEGLSAGVAVLADPAPQLRDVHREVGADGDQPQRVPSQAEDLESLADAVVDLRRRVGGERLRLLAHAALADVAVALRVARDGEAGQVRHRRARQDHAGRLVRESEEAAAPRDDGALDVDADVVAALRS
jgi:hypothetical protein